MIRPTLYIGLGGVGGNIVRTLKKSIEEKFSEEERTGLGFMVLDTHPHDVSDNITTEEYLGLSIGIVPHVVARNNPKYLGWYTHLMGKWEAESVQSGANAIRAVGRLAFLNPPTLNLFISKLTNIFNHISQAITEEIPKVYVISSLGGGTGSGILIDVFTILRHFLTTRRGSNFKFQAILIIPDALAGEVPYTFHPRLFANTYATLKEIFHFVCGHENKVIKYADNIGPYSVPITGSLPIMFIITDKNEKGVVITPTMEEVIQTVVLYLLLEIQSPPVKKEGVKVHDLENVERGKLGEGGMPKDFCSFGLIQAGFPYEMVKEIYVKKILSEFIYSELTCSKIDIPAEVKKFVSDNSLMEMGADQLQEKIVGESKVNLDIKGMFEDVKPRNVDEKCDEYKREIEETVINRQYKEIEENKSNFERSLIGVLKNKCLEKYRKENLASVEEFLKHLKSEIEIHKNALVDEINETQNLLNELEETLNQSLNNVREVVKIKGFGSAERIKSAAGSFITKLQNYLNTKIKLQGQQLANQVYNNLIEFIDQLNKSLENINNWLKSTYDSTKFELIGLSNKLNELSNYRSFKGRRFSLFSVKEIDAIFNKIITENEKKEIINEIREYLKKKDVFSDITKEEKEEFLEKCKETLQNLVDKKFEKENLLTLLNHVYKKEDIKNKFENLKTLGKTLFLLDPNTKESYTRIWIIGANDTIKNEIQRYCESYLKEGDEGINLASYPSPYEILISQITHGYTLHSLASLGNYYAYYTYLQNQYKELKTKIAIPPVHAWEDADEWEEIFPQRGEEEALRVFALGRAFSYIFPSALNEDGTPKENENTSFIYNRGNNYYILIKKEGEGDEEILLGQGIEKALEKFSEDEDLQKWISNRIEEKIKEVGAKEVKKLLEKKFMPVLEEEIKKATKEERKKILKKIKVEIENYLEEISTTI